MQVPKSASFRWPCVSSNMLSGFTSLLSPQFRRQHTTDINHELHHALLSYCFNCSQTFYLYTYKKQEALQMQRDHTMHHKSTKNSPGKSFQ